MKSENPRGGKSPEDILKRTFKLAVRIVEFCRTLQRSSPADRTLIRQLLRAGTSIGANLEEGQAAQSKADFLSKYAIALKEARETCYWIRLISETCPTFKTPADPLLAEVIEVSRILGSIIVRTKRREGNS